MISKNTIYKKQIITKKTALTVFYGIIFLISTISYFFVNNSKAENVIKLNATVIDEDIAIDDTCSEIKVSENDNQEYIVKFPKIQTNFVVKKYIFVNEEDFNTYNNYKEKIKKLTENEEKDESSENENTASNTEKTSESSNTVNNTGKPNVDKDKNLEQIEKEFEEFKKEIIENGVGVAVEPEEDYVLSDEEIENKNIYVIAEYDTEEKHNQILYNKYISKQTEQNNIIINGYMPKDAEIKVSDVDVSNVQDKINEKYNSDVKLKTAYDIKILVDDKEYEPDEFDENVQVTITGIDEEKVNIWHVKDDENIEMINSNYDENLVNFKATEFSIYGVEVVETEDNATSENTTDGNTNNTENSTQDSGMSTENLSASSSNTPNITMKSPVRRAAASTLPDSTLEIDDYDSDYYYYIGKNYTDKISGENAGTYRSSNLIKVTVNYYGYAEGEKDNEMKGRISLTETQDIIKNTRCVPILNGSVSIELMDNPFMDKPTGYGFGGWTSNNGVISTDSNTGTQTLKATATSDLTINLYANWKKATVVYVNPDVGADDRDDGLSEDKPFGSWGKAFEYLYNNSSDRSDRENNIIVLTGNIDSSINYTRPTYATTLADITYTSSTTPTSGETYIISTTTGSGGNAINSDLDVEKITNNSVPSTSAQWIITSSGGGYTIQNSETKEYLTYNYGLGTGSNATVWQFNTSNRRFYYRSGSRSYYLRLYSSYYNNDSYWTTTTSTYSATSVYFLKYEATNQRDSVTKSSSISSNSNYTSSRNVAVTVTSLYNHTDYRDNATMDLTNSSYSDFDIYNSFQMDYVKINTTGYTSNSDGTTLTESYSWLNGMANNVRLGRGIECANTSTSGCTFANIIGGGVSVGNSNNYNHAYKLVVESGKYSSIQGFNYYEYYGSTYNYYGTIYLTLGNDIDRVNCNNDGLSVYYRTTINSGYGINGTGQNGDKSFLIDVKSGRFGTDYFDNYGADTNDSAYSGIYVGGYGVGASSNTRDISDRYFILEGGVISNIIGGLKVTENSGVDTKIYVKGGEAYNIVGGAGVSATYEDRFIQVTGGVIRYSVSGGSNGVYAESSTNNGKLNGNTLVYIGGNAQIGTESTLSSTVYGVPAGCVLGAGNGNESYKNSGAGQVDTSHIIVDQKAHILNSVYGGGNYGVVGTKGSTTGTTKVEILGGTIDGSSYGGANQNDIYGSTLTNVKGGQVKGAVYGGSNTSGTISTTTTINVTGGILGQESNTTDNQVLFGGGYGSSTVVTGETVVNILDTDADSKIYGSAYGGSSLGTMKSNVTVNIQDIPDKNKTINIVGNVFAGGRGNSSTSATILGNATINVDGSDLPKASVFGGNDLNGTTQGAITVNIGKTYKSTLLNAYGGGNEDATGTETDSVYVYLLDNANVTNAFNGGKSADLTTSGTSDTTRAIYLRGGNAENVFGGSDTSGTVTASHVYVESGKATNVYGGNNKGGQTTESFVYITGATTTNVYGGGYQASTPTTNVSLTGGTITNGFGGGNAADVTTANIVLNGTASSSIYGGSNENGTVTKSNVTITSGKVTNVYGGNNAGGDTIDTNVLVTSETTNVYGGGNEAITSGTTYLKLTNATIKGAAYGGGNGSAAVVSGNSTTIVEGTTSISGDLYGGGNAATNGSTSNNNVVVQTLITGGTIKGDVYGAANTSVVYGSTQVKIGTTAVNDSSLTKRNIEIDGTVFGGGKSNTAGSENYDFTFESVTGDANIDINATDYDDGTYTFNIKKSVFGSGNAAKISGSGYVTITNYGTEDNIKENVSIQRATQVILNNCHMYFSGTTDTTNEIATAVYTFNRIDDLELRNNTTIYLESGVNIVAKLKSLDASGNKETVTIGDSGITSQNVNNKIYLLQGKNIILKTEAGNDGEVSGMTFVGLYKGIINRVTGIYGDDYTDGSTISDDVAETFSRNSYVQGKHYSNHDINVDGYYTKYNVDGVVDVQYIEPTPDDAAYYQWIVGEKSTDIYYENIELIATKYATTATYVLSLNGLSYPNMTVKVVDFDISDLSTDITLNDPDTIPNIAKTAEDADTKFGLTMTAGNSGWQTKGTTYFLNNGETSAGYRGKTQYLSDNSSATPTFSFYMAHSKNISSTGELGTITIKLEALYEENDEIKIKNAYVVIKLTTNNTLKMDKDYYEGAITPGKEYKIFPTTTTTITQKSSFSAYYSLYINDYSKTNYYEGFSGYYYHTLTSSCILPEKTKITLIDMSGENPKYYYYIVSADDVKNNKKVYKFTDFKAMDSKEEPYSADGSYYNSTTDLLYEDYIVHVNFEDTSLTSSLESQNLVVQLRDIFDDTVAITVNTASYPMLFSVYNNIDVDTSLKLTTNKDIIYMGNSLEFNIESNYAFKKNSNSDIVYDTTHIDDALGIRITISSGSKILTSSDLQGIYISYNGTNYFARSDGSFRIKVADAVANVLANMTLYTENGELNTGTYTITAQSFGSIDGTYFSTEIESASKDIQIINTNYGFDVDLDDNSALINKDTGKTKNDKNTLDFTIGYSGNFENTKICVSLYRRKYDEIYSYKYEKVDLADYVSTELLHTNTENEYLVTDLVLSIQKFTLTLKEALKTGTYKIRFSLYDNDTLITFIDKPVIIKK